MLNNVRVIAVIIVHGTPKRISPYPLPLMFLSNMLMVIFCPPMFQAGAVKSMNIADIKSNYKCPYVDGTRCRF